MPADTTDPSARTVRDVIAGNPYPGRLLVLARGTGGDLAAVYALTGRSPASKARRMELSADGDLDVLSTNAGPHDALRHYTGGTVSERWTVFGNGAQVSDVANRLADGAIPAAALDDLEYEPDPPIYTSRITAVVDRRDGRCWLGAARRSGGQRTGTDITVTALADLSPGDAVLLSTYVSDGTEIRAAVTHLDLGTPAKDHMALLDEVWDALGPAYRIAAAAFDPVSGLHGEIRHEPVPDQG